MRSGMRLANCTRILHNTQLHGIYCDSRGVGLLRSGDDRPRPRAPRARPVRARLRLARGAARDRPRPAAGPERRTPRATASSRTRRRSRAAPTSSSSASTTSGRPTLEPPSRGVVVDLSGAHRLADASLYAEWYGFDASARRPSSRTGRTRFPSSASVALAAGREPGLLRDRGAPGARARSPGSPIRRASCRRREVRRLGRGPGPPGRARTPARCSRTSPRTRSGRHQHEPEIEQVLGFPVCFVPHLLPVRRGLIATCYVKADAAEARELLEAAYVGLIQR